MLGSSRITDTYLLLYTRLEFSITIIIIFHVVPDISLRAERGETKVKQQNIFYGAVNSLKRGGTLSCEP